MYNKVTLFTFREDGDVDIKAVLTRPTNMNDRQFIAFIHTVMFIYDADDFLEREDVPDVITL